MILSPFWLPATLGAALFQSWRTALQQRLRGSMSVNAAGLVRYLYGLPTALLLLLATLGDGLPWPGAATLSWALAGGLAQIAGTNLLILSFGYRNYVVGTAYSKTDAVQGALLGAAVLGESLRPLAWLGVGTSVLGTLLLSLAGGGGGPGGGRAGGRAGDRAGGRAGGPAGEKAGRGAAARLAGLLRAAAQPAALCGLGAGLAFSLSGLSVKLAAGGLPAALHPVPRALLVLVLMNAMQIVLQGGWMLWREPTQLRGAFTAWRVAAPVGALSALGSACWFLGFVLAPLGLVRSVGQVEILFTLLLGRFFLRERFSRAEVLGAVTVVAGVLLVLAGA